MKLVIKNFIEKKLDTIDQRHSQLLLIARLREEYSDQMAKYVYQFIAPKPQMEKVYVVARHSMLSTPFDEFSAPCIDVLEEIIDSEDFYADVLKVDEYFDWMVKNKLASPLDEIFNESSGGHK